LEDLGFRYTNPEKYKEIAQNLSETRLEREKQMEEILSRLKKVLAEVGIKAEITGRSKHIYSIYRKMVEKNKPFELVRDLRGVRLIVKDIPSCYAALGVIHTNWRPIPNEFDDYIAAPKDNFYQSLHTAILYDDGKPLEVQIRTPEMDENAEYGIAAHWKYKEKGPRDEVYEQRINWLKKLMEWRQEVEDANEFVDGMKTDVFQDRVYVFTPRGDIIDLPAGSTPIDFAYNVHTEIGHRCRGAKVNGKLVSLDHVLKTGDQVEILAAKQGGPSRDWLNSNLGLVKTQRARSKIRQWFKHQNREQNLSQGKEILDKELRRLGLTDFNLEKLALSFDFRTLDDLYVAVGCGDISIGHVINLLSDVETQPTDQMLIKPGGPAREISGSAVSILGLKNILTTYAKCCKPVPGDDIIGYITRGRGATIHRQDCPNILRIKDRDRLVRVTWGEPQLTFPVEIQIKAYDRQGLMGDISSLLTDENINVKDIKINITHNLAYLDLVVEISNIAQLARVLTKIENLPNVMEAHRLKPG
jgi:GTP pyrophosphokinase